MLLTELLDEAVADVSADLPALTDASRRRGTTIRRRRRVAASIGATAAAAVVGLGVVVAWPGESADDHVTDDGPPTLAESLSGRTVPMTAPGAAAALVAAIDEVADGTVSDLQASVTGPATVSAELAFVPSPGTGPAGSVMIDVSPLGNGPDWTSQCEEIKRENDVEDCRVRQLDDGDEVVVIDIAEGASSRPQHITIVQLVSRERDLFVTSFATDALENADQPPRAEPVLTEEQLVAIVTQPWWDAHEVPEEFAAEGERLDVPELEERGAEADGSGKVGSP